MSRHTSRSASSTENALPKGTVVIATLAVVLIVGVALIVRGLVIS